ncbi:ABC-type bacteriocin/lantibiotic exporter with double-glycine peptidase domain [Methylohalomonas lacus]|uniref:ABC-type bacteriocin/lantibiotic exporter with double-glycine peptidase domain n=1 Tax=Methylohalomonas lacus TaxID=398773 RepID=A0AAE3L2E1_9GAMM|nr:ABC transporter ATP-binding protein [Methylohalomonas lacus]MCS3904376.1 ABC-type bacteriocin/lantibiotic exporter with double-glycine peptidase domain [Methylohalomonas lacus]
MPEAFRKIFFLLSRGERRRGILVLGMITVMAVLETAGVASVMPFLSVLANPEVVRTNDKLALIYATFDFNSVDDFLMVLGIGAFLLILVSAVFRGITVYVMNRYVEMRGHGLACRLLETYLRQPYSFFLNRHSGDLSKSVLSEVAQLVSNVLRPGMELVAYSIVLLGILSLLLLIDPLLALAVGVVLGGLYGILYMMVRKRLARIGQDRIQANQERFTAAGEALSGIKDIKLLGREHAYLDRFLGPSFRFARHQATSHTLSQVPNYLVEAIAFGGIIVLVLVMLSNRGGVEGGMGEVLPLLGLYTFAGYRLKPAAQKLFSSLAKLRFGGPVLEAVYQDLEQRTALAEIRDVAEQPLVPKDAIALKDIYYTYPGAAREALSGINLSIPVGSSLGLIGTTGAGKTTLVDIILGLLRPTRGRIIVDDEPVTDSNLRAWQQTLGYVPQDIFLADNTVAENIALGIAADRIDRQQVERCARMAQVHEFIMQEMPEQYETRVGERGVRLSGGQRQRLGIARALYHDPAILVFDEATSALDTVTEQAVMEAIEGLHHKKTVILIAHRLTTVSNCDRIVRLERGRAMEENPDTILQKNNS